MVGVASVLEVGAAPTQRRRPAVLGLSVGHPSGSKGSIGPFVILRNGRIGFLSTVFALAPQHARGGDYIHQPGPSDVEVLTNDTRLAKLVSSTKPALGKINCAVAAVAEFLEGCAPASPVLPEWSNEAGRPIVDIIDPSDLAPGDEVAFVGCGSGYSRGRVIEAAHPYITVGGFDVGPVITVEADAGSFSQQGDGGALLYRCEDCRAVGLLVAREGTEGRPRSAFLPLSPIFDALDLRLWK